MRIVQLSTRMDFYGGEVCLCNLAAGLRDRGHEVTCVVRPGSRLETAVAELGLETCALPLVDWFEPVSISRLRRWLRNRRVQILHTHLPRDWFIAATATAGTTVRNVGTRHQIHPISCAVLKRPFLRGFSTLISVSEAVRAEVLARRIVPADRAPMIHNGIAPPAGAAGSGRGLRSRAQVAEGAPVVGFVGRLSPDKDVATLLRAVDRLRVRHPDVRAFLVGDGEADPDYLTALRALVARRGLDGHVHFFGFVPEAAAVTGEFDVQVVSSLAEPFGLVTLEAMAAGRPVVVTDTGGSPEIVRDGVEGFHFRPGDDDALARRLDLLLESPGLRVEMGRRGRERVRRSFSLGRMLDRTEAVYRAAAS